MSLHMDFKDYADKTINLSAESWEHIQEFHPEVTIEEIREVLLRPNLVRQSRYKNMVHLYYATKVSKSGKNRWTQVVVKFCNDGNFISTAMTVNKPKKGDMVFVKPD
ncbi:hypothetical protein OAQ84_00570 [Bdellovibrionales bacterium]|nr:hypothetical protein [Bdellovibrionales bacterium]